MNASMNECMNSLNKLPNLDLVTVTYHTNKLLIIRKKIYSMGFQVYLGSKNGGER